MLLKATNNKLRHGTYTLIHDVKHGSEDEFVQTVSKPSKEPKLVQAYEILWCSMSQCLMYPSISRLHNDEYEASLMSAFKGHTD